jgi:hypothetical protein
MAFHGSQVVFLDPNVVAGAPEIGITAIDLYFKAKPGQFVNKSGIRSPGVTLFLVPTVDSVPVLDDLCTAPRARVEFESIMASADASLKTTFRFPQPIATDTDYEYAIILLFDGEEDFTLWKSVAGEYLVGTTIISPGASGQNMGPYYDYISPSPQANTGQGANSSMVTQGSGHTNKTFADSDYTTRAWRPVADTTLKLTVYCARYSFGGNANLHAFTNPLLPANAQIHTTGSSSYDAATGETIFRLPTQRYEYVVFDSSWSSTGNVVVGELAYQNTVFYPGGTANADATSISVTANSKLVTATGINWNNIFVLSDEPSYIVIVSPDHLGANADLTNVREVVEIVSNTVIKVKEPLSFSNTTARFKIAPVARVDQWCDGRLFGNQAQIVILAESTANSTVRFVNNSISALSCSANGTGYSNSDYVTITGFESVSGKVLGGYSAKANVVTHANGTISALHLSNVGAGFVNTAAIVCTISNNTGGATTGSGAVLVANVGSLIKTEFLGTSGRGGWFANVELINIEIGQEIPGLVVNNPGGTFYRAFHRLPYFSEDDSATLKGKAYYCDSNTNADVFSIKPFVVHQPWDYTKRRCLPSWSNEYYLPYAANGTACQASGGSSGDFNEPGLSNSSTVIIRSVANTDFGQVGITGIASTITFQRYLVNNSYANEHTNYGNAISKGIEVKVNLQENNFAEDIRVYSTVYRPYGTDIKMYARIHNSTDPEAFDDKDWTLLELKDGIGVYSALHDESDRIELTWGFPQYGNAQYTLDGSATSVLNQSNLVGANTTWSTNTTANLVAGDVVRIYQPLFPNNHQIAVVETVTNNTLITLNTTVSNNGMVGSGLIVEKMEFPRQAFNTILNANVARYISASQIEYDTFGTFQMKPVFTSEDGFTVPRMDDLRVVGVSS